MSDRTLISSGSSFEALAGYSRAVVIGDDVLVSGTTGFDYTRMTIADDAVAQTHQCFANIAQALAQAGCTLDDVVRVQYLLTDAALFEPLAPIFGQDFRVARPAATAMVVGLAEPRMKVTMQ
ncbi:MAG: RidA family protein, partial [Xanthomonadales bacterium]|nr:RidA family protein [Xanthomonadales bacterium]